MHYSNERKRAAIAIFHEVKRLKKENDAPFLDPVALASIAAGGASRTQIYEWSRQGLPDDPPIERRGARRLLSEDQESLLVGFACNTRSSLLPLSLELLRRFAQNYMRVTISLSTLCTIMQRHGFSSQKSLGRNSRMVDPQVVDEAILALEEIRSYGFSPDRIICMDETGLWSNVAAPRTYHFKNGYATTQNMFIFIF